MLIKRPVFLDLLTSEPTGEGEILRVRAIRLDPDFSTSEPPPSLERLAKPETRLKVSQARLTGLSNRDLEDAPELEVVLQDLHEFSDGAGAWIVAEGDVTRRTMRRVNMKVGIASSIGPPVIGVDDLEAVVHPTRGHDIDSSAVAEDDEVPLQRSNDPASLRDRWTTLERELRGLPLPLLAEMNWLLAKSRHPLKGVLKKAESLAVNEGYSLAASSGKLTLAKLFRDFSEIVRRLQAPKEDAVEEIVQGESADGVDTAEVAALFKPEGPFSEALPDYEDRPQQTSMAERVAKALNDGRHLIAEAGTGVGKSLAYLAPAVRFAENNGRPVIISTHTKNLQSQLFEKDIELLRKATNGTFRAARLKGRANYLCLRKFMFSIQESAHELESEERGALLPVMTWATQTEEGDVAELSAFSPEEHPALWDRLHTVGEDCLARQCPYYNRCFVYRARGLTRDADIVVTNHALVFADLNAEAGALPPYQEIVFDEAHTLEDVATGHLSCEITPRRVYRILNRLFRTTKGSRAGKGILPSLLFHLDQSREELAEPLLQSVRGHVLDAIQAVDPATKGADAFFEDVLEWFEDRNAPASVESDRPAEPYVPREPGRRPPPAMADLPFTDRADRGSPGPMAGRRRRQGRTGGREERRRYSSKDLRPDEIEALEAAKTAVVAGLGRLRQTLDRVSEDLKEIRKAKMGRARELSKEIAAQNLFLQELISDVEFVIKGEETNYVYWMERLGRKSLRMVAAPLDLSALLHDQVYDRKRSVILTSATLSVRSAEAEEGYRQHSIPSFQKNPGGILSPPASLLEREQDAPEPETTKPSPKSFMFLKQRLGLSLCEEDQLDELLEGSPFDYERQCRLFVPTFLPEPTGARGSAAFNDALSAMVASLALACQGRAMALYTSYAALDASARYLRKALPPEGIEVLAQGQDGSREALLERLKEGGRTVLLGTASFWEGVDVPGEALSLLVIAKLPFAVFTDPLIEGRCELLEAQGKDPFLHFSVPNAIIRLRQGFGRLIRSKKDRGAVVLCDKRVWTKRYGPAFLRALPAPARKTAEAERLTEEVREFLVP